MNAVNASGTVTATSTWFADPAYASNPYFGFSCGFVGNDTVQVGCLGDPYNNPSLNTIQDPLNVSAWEGAGTISLSGPCLYSWLYEWQSVI